MELYLIFFFLPIVYIFRAVIKTITSILYLGNSRGIRSFEKTGAEI